MAATRTIFVSLPLILTFLTLIGLLLAFTGNVSDNSIAQHFHLLGITSTAADGTNATQTVGMWNSCVHESSGQITCNATQAAYFFNPLTEYNVSAGDLALLDPQWPSAFAEVIDTFRRLTKWGFTLYILAIILTVLVFPVSFFAYRSRGGSVAAVLLNILGGICVIAGSTLYTVVFASLYTFIREAVSQAQSEGVDVQITPDLNRSALAVMWLAVAATILAFFFWAATACCCSGVRYHNREAYNLVEHQPPIITGSHHVHGYAQDDYQHVPAQNKQFRDSKFGNEPIQPHGGRYEPYTTQPSY